MVLFKFSEKTSSSLYSHEMHVNRREKSEKRKTKNDKKKKINARRKKHDKTEQRFGIVFILLRLGQVAHNPFKAGFLTGKRHRCMCFS